MGTIFPFHNTPSPTNKKQLIEIFPPFVSVDGAEAEVPRRGTTLGFVEERAVASVLLVWRVEGEVTTRNIIMLEKWKRPPLPSPRSLGHLPALSLEPPHPPVSQRPPPRSE